MCDPEWIVHRFDVRSGRFQFIRISVEEIRAATFMADLKPATSTDSIWVDALELNSQSFQRVPIHFIFHTAFCRSTLLVSALDIPGISFGLSEPAVLNDLAHAGPRAAGLIRPVLDLLARPLGGAKTIVVKPSNFANSLMPAIMGAQPDAKALLLSGSLAGFLQSVHKKGLAGRGWIRRLYRHVQSYAGLDLGLRGDAEFELTDLQVAALAWFLQQRHFAMMLDTSVSDRMATLHSHELAETREDSLRATASFFDLRADRKRINAIVNGPRFQLHAKLGGDYAHIIEMQAASARSEVVDTEIEIIEKWIDAIVVQTGLQLPVSKPVQTA